MQQEFEESDVQKMHATSAQISGAQGVEQKMLHVRKGPSDEKARMRIVLASAHGESGEDIAPRPGLAGNATPPKLKNCLSECDLYC